MRMGLGPVQGIEDTSKQPAHLGQEQPKMRRVAAYQLTGDEYAKLHIAALQTGIRGTC